MKPQMDSNVLRLSLKFLIANYLQSPDAAKEFANNQGKGFDEFINRLSGADSLDDLRDSWRALYPRGDEMPKVDLVFAMKLLSAVLFDEDGRFELEGDPDTERVDLIERLAEILKEPGYTRGLNFSVLNDLRRLILLGHEHAAVKRLESLNVSCSNCGRELKTEERETVTVMPARQHVGEPYRIFCGKCFFPERVVCATKGCERLVPKLTVGRPALCDDHDEKRPSKKEEKLKEALGLRDVLVADHPQRGRVVYDFQPPRRADR